MSGIKSKILQLNDKNLPDLKHAENLIDKKTKAILLVSPNNPTGIEYPNDMLIHFYKIAKKNNN